LPRTLCFFRAFFFGAAFFATTVFLEVRFVSRRFLLRTFFELVCFFFFFLFLLVAMAGVYHRRAKSRSFPPLGTAGGSAGRRWDRIAHEARLAKRRNNLYSACPELPKGPNSLSDLTPDLLVGFIWYVAFLFSTTCHEAAHAFVAKMGGDETAALGGQVSLNPVPHMRREPWGMIVIPLLSFLAMHTMFGWASAPFDPLWERRHPRRSAWMALAGPTANFSLMFLAVIGLRVGAIAGWFHRDPVTHNLDFAATTLLIFFSLNLLLGTFNLLPVVPLDGSTVIMLFMSEKTAQKYLDWLRGNSFALAGLLVGILLFRYIYDPINTFVSALLLPGHI